VLALSQLNRSVESRNDKRPMMSDLRESGCHRTGRRHHHVHLSRRLLQQGEQGAGVSEIVIAKQRNGPVARSN